MIKLILVTLLSTLVLSVNKCNNASSNREQPAQSEEPIEQPQEKSSGHKPANISTLQVLYAKYKNGEIEACRYNGATVYKAGLNAPDAGSVIYNGEGIKIGSCNYGWGKPDSMCHELMNCEDIYRVADNIWDKPAVDKYDLGKN